MGHKSDCGVNDLTFPEDATELDCTCGDVLEQKNAEINRLTGERAVLQGALLTYGHHTSACRWNGGFDCTCGWSDIAHGQPK